MAESKTSNTGSKAKAAQDKGPTDAEKALADAKAEAKSIIDNARQQANQIAAEASAEAEQIRQAAEADAETVRNAALADAERLSHDVAAGGGFAVPGTVDITAEEAAAVFALPVTAVHAHHLREDGRTVVVVTTNGQKLVGTV